MGSSTEDRRGCRAEIVHLHTSIQRVSASPRRIAGMPNDLTGRHAISDRDRSKARKHRWPRTLPTRNHARRSPTQKHNPRSSKYTCWELSGSIDSPMLSPHPGCSALTVPTRLGWPYVCVPRRQSYRPLFRNVLNVAAQPKADQPSPHGVGESVPSPVADQAEIELLDLASLLSGTGISSERASVLMVGHAHYRAH